MTWQKQPYTNQRKQQVYSTFAKRGNNLIYCGSLIASPLGFTDTNRKKWWCRQSWPVGPGRCGAEAAPSWSSGSWGRTRLQPPHPSLLTSLPTETLQQGGRNLTTVPQPFPDITASHDGARSNAGKKSCTEPTNGINVDWLHCSGWLGKSQTCSNIKLFPRQNDTFAENLFLIRLQESIFPLPSAQNEYEYP